MPLAAAACVNVRIDGGSAGSAPHPGASLTTLIMWRRINRAGGSLRSVCSKASDRQGPCPRRLGERRRALGYPSAIVDRDDRLLFTGIDDRGVELEIIAVPLPTFLNIIHVMPTQFRR